MTLKAWRTRDHALSSIQSWEFKPENPQIGMDHQWDYTVKGWVRKKNCQAKIRFPHEICHFQDWTGGNIINKTLYKQSVVISLLSYKSGVLIYTNQWVRKTSGWDLKLACFRFGGTIAIKQKPSQILSGRKSILVGLSDFYKLCTNNMCSQFKKILLNIEGNMPSWLSISRTILRFSCWNYWINNKDLFFNV